MSNPSLQDVRNRRRQLRAEIAALNAEDSELYAAEKVLLRLGGIAEPAPLPLPPYPPLPPATPVNPVKSSGSLGGSAALFRRRPDPNLPPPPSAEELAAAVASLEEEDGEQGDGGAGLVKLVQDVMVGNETLEQLTLLLFRNCSDTWWTATEIQDYLQRIKGKEVPMNSISPMLTAMKNAGTIVRDGHNVALTEKAHGVRLVAPGGG
ncbi:hypothetical protein [Bradyrhizobium liaoningense]